MSEKTYATRPNKTQLKREIKVFNQMGRELVELPVGALAKMPLSETMRDAVNEGKRLSRGALQRQLRRIASLMGTEDVDAIRFELERLKQPSKAQTAEFHLLEQWRDRLIGGDEPLLTELIDRFPLIDRQHIRQMVRNSQLEQKRNKPPKASRLLFKYLKETKANANEGVANEPTLELLDEQAEQESNL